MVINRSVLSNRRSCVLSAVQSDADLAADINLSLRCHHFEMLLMISVINRGCIESVVDGI